MRIENGNLNVNGTTRINQLFDYVNSSGTTGQVLTSVPSGVQWSNVDAVITGSTTGKLNVSDFNTFTASTLPSTYFRQSGNTFGVTAILGTNDNQDLAFETNGVVRMSVLSGGNVGIGTTNPNSTLHVLGAAGGTVAFEGDSSQTTLLLKQGTNLNYIVGLTNNISFRPNGTEALYLRGSNSNVGIGTSSPSARLHVRGAGATLSTTGLRVEDSNSISSLVIRDDRNVGVGIDNPSAQFHISGNTSSSNPLLVNTSGGTVALSVNNNGNVGVGTSTPAFTLDVNGTARATTLLETSSERYKTNITPLPKQSDIINKLNPVTFNWKDETKGNGVQYGLIAEEVLNIIPDAVETNDDGTAEAISYTKLVPILIKAVQELQMEVNELKEKLNK